MRVINWLCETGFAGADHRGQIEVDDNATDVEIDEIVSSEIYNHINWSWWEDRKDGKS